MTDSARTGDVAAIMSAIDHYITQPKVAPWSGWHDDHRGKDRTGDYMPALQQVRGEFMALVTECVEHGLIGGKCLQLGLGLGGCAHVALREMFEEVVTVECDAHTVASLGKHWPIVAGHDRVVVGYTQDDRVRAVCRSYEPFDLLFIDAGHRYTDVKADHEAYAPMVRAGGIVAFHDSLKRPGYETEIDVWRYLADANIPNLLTFGTEVGVSLYIKEE